MRSLRKQQSGFTILELLIATMVFSVIFLGATTVLVQIGKLYYKGVVTDRTQETTRSAVDQISQQLQFSSDAFVGATTRDYSVPNLDGSSGPKLTMAAVCVGSTRYSYKLNVQVSGDVTTGRFDNTNLRLQHALWRDTIPTGVTGCDPADLSQANPSAASGGSNGQEMLAQNMRLAAFDVQCPPNSGSTCTVKVGVIYGDNDLLAPVPDVTDPFAAAKLPTHCGSVIGDQWCATSQLSTVVLRRVAK